MIPWDRTKGRPEPVHLLDRVPLRENHELLVSILEHCPKVVAWRPQTIPYVRATVAAMLNSVAESLPAGIHLAVTDAWRPFARQVRIYEFMMRCAIEVFPNRSYQSLKRTVNRWVAPVDRKSPPGHCTGAAVDVLLYDDKYQEIDVCAPFSRFQAAPTYSLGLAAEAQEMRDLLVNSMLAAGFSNCRDEWWHYSYGDSGWAVRLDMPECFYGLIDLDPSLYTEQEQLAEEALKSRPNPFIHARNR